MVATRCTRLSRMSTCAIIACLVLAGCTRAETGAPLPEGHVECPAPMQKQAPDTQCVAPEAAQRLGASCSSDGTCVISDQVTNGEPDGIIDCPVVHSAPGSTDPTIVYTPPCVRKSLGGGAFYIYDGNGVLIGGGTP
jgi:hypothetical protein